MRRGQSRFPSRTALGKRFPARMALLYAGLSLLEPYRTRDAPLGTLERFCPWGLCGFKSKIRKQRRNPKGHKAVPRVRDGPGLLRVNRHQPGPRDAVCRHDVPAPDYLSPRHANCPLAPASSLCEKDLTAGTAAGQVASVRKSSQFLPAAVAALVLALPCAADEPEPEPDFVLEDLNPASET